MHLNATTPLLQLMHRLHAFSRALFAGNQIAWDGPLSSFSGSRQARMLLMLGAVMLLAWIVDGYSWLVLFMLLTIGNVLGSFTLVLWRSLQDRVHARWWLIAATCAMAVIIGSALGTYVALSAELAIIPWLDIDFLFLLAFSCSSISLLLEVWRNHRNTVSKNQTQAEQGRLRLERALLEAELRTLQAQVEPHFLYNTLANVQYLTQKEPALASKMLGHLISYLRASLPDLRAPASTIKRECQLASDFLAIMAVRMQGRLHYRVDCPVQLHGRSCPPLMLISLVENAIKHGIEPQPDGGSVTVTISERANALILSVADTGAGLTGETSGSGVGLANIVTRLRALYGEAASFRLAANAPRGVVAIISLPLSYTV